MWSFLTDPVWLTIVVAGLVGVLTIVVPLVQVAVSRLRQELTYRVISSTSLVHKKAQNAVQVSLNDGTQIPDADFSVFRVKNTGNSPITKDDYIKEISFQFPERDIIHLTEVITEPTAGLIDQGDLRISPVGQIPAEITLLKPVLPKNISIIFSLLTRGTQAMETAAIRPLGGLKGGPVKAYQTQKGIPRSFVIMGVGALVILFALAIAYLRPLIAPSSNCATGSTTIGGSTALLPLVSSLTQQYHALCPGAIITVNQGVTSSKDGLAALGAGNIQIGDSDLATGNQSFSDYRVAGVIYIMIVNMDVVGVNNLKTQDIRGIYSGTITNWNQLGGPNESITPVNRTTTSGTRVTFEHYVLHKDSTTFPPLTHYPPLQDNLYDEQGTSVLMAQKVATTPGAIGYVDLSDFRTMQQSLKALTIDGVLANSDHVKDLTYPFWTIEHMYTQTNASDLTNAFIAYVTGISPGRKNDLSQLIRNLGYIPISDIVSVISKHPSPRAPNGL